MIDYRSLWVYSLLLINFVLANIHHRDDHISDTLSEASSEGTFLKSDPTPDMPDKKLVQFYGFKFCSKLNGAAFDVKAPLKLKTLVPVMKHLKIPYTPQRPRIMQKFKNFWRRVKNLFTKGKWGLEGSPYDYVFNIQNITDHFPAVVDELAKSLYVHHTHRYRFFDSKEPGEIHQVSKYYAKRLSCYLAADGYNTWIRYGVKARVLQFVEPKQYFGADLGFSRLDLDLGRWEMHRMGTSKNVPICDKPKPPLRLPPGKKIKSKLAYLLLVNKDFASVKKVLDAIYDEDVVVVIHVDGKSTDLMKKVKKMLQETNGVKYRYDPKRVQLAKLCLRCSWGHSSLVMAQLIGFFQLLEMDNTWEYVINLSGNDYPLLPNKNIYATLKEAGELNWIQFWSSLQAQARLHAPPALQSEGPNEVCGIAALGSAMKSFDLDLSAKEIKNIPDYHKFFILGPRKLTPVYNWEFQKHHQWMILTRKFVEAIRRSPSAAQWMAFQEFVHIPDEAYFINIATNLVTKDPYTGRAYTPPVVNHMRRYLYFRPGAKHPVELTINDLETLRGAVEEGAMFTRKIDLVKEIDLVLAIEREKKVMWHI